MTSIVGNSTNERLLSSCRRDWDGSRRWYCRGSLGRSGASDNIKTISPSGSEGISPDTQSGSGSLLLLSVTQAWTMADTCASSPFRWVRTEYVRFPMVRALCRNRNSTLRNAFFCLIGPKKNNLSFRYIDKKMEARSL